MLYSIVDSGKLPDPNAGVWRYFDFPKFISLLEQRQIALARADTFDDPYEGHWSEPTVAKLVAKSSLDQSDAHIMRRILEQPNSERLSHFISCWHINEHESAAMWKLYVGATMGIAIRTTMQALADEVAKSEISACIARVVYLDYSAQELPHITSYDPYYHKRISFEHEKELRVIAWAGHSKNRFPQFYSEKVVFMNVDLSNLVKAVHVSPLSPPWFGALVERIMQRYGLFIPIEKSTLDFRPLQ